MGDLSGKAVLITGAGSGIGAVSAKLIARRGASVVLSGIPYEAVAARAEELEATGGHVEAVRCDVTREIEVEAAVARCVARFGRLDAVVANAGIQRHNTDRDLYKLDESEWELTQDVNLRGVMRTAKHGIAQMMAQGDGGSVVIISSITAVSGTSANVSYTTAKAALLGFNRHLAVHYAQHGIRSNAILPGALEQTPDWSDHPNPDRRRAAMEAAIPLGRLGRPEDIAPWVAFLVSDESSYATGAQFCVDGGITIR